MRLTRVLVPAAFVLSLLAGCGEDTDGADGAPATENPAAGSTVEDGTRAQRYPDVVDVTVDGSGDAYDFSVTISSPYDSPERYADGWRITGDDGTVYGEHTLGHDHANEQPFTRTQTGVSIPDSVAEVTVQARDTEHGYGGDTRTVPLP